MIAEMDELLQHWADQHRRGGQRQSSPLGIVVEFGGVPPRSSAPKGSRDPLGLGELDDSAWQVEQGLARLSDKLQAIADEHYRQHGYSDEKARRLGMARRTYFDTVHRLHYELKQAMKDNLRRARRA